ncbi:MAG: DUF4906 domain-containing protein [Prevotella sp.]|uniref:DUF4906 domain-containing protein n=1 Tax=Prevotella sp. TaxID=59823 RepID=UPI00257B4F0B|nr:DUF4906 domain-containing protein [Prevotella sp.]MBS5874627.1 DUF4906 domain-containing protein [Prevotella sp.]
MKKIHLKIYTGILAVCMIMAGLSSCTVDDFFGTDNVVEGEPVNITLNFAAVPSTDVRITRATGSDLSELSDIVICVFHGDGSFEQMVTNYDEGGGLTVNGNKVGANGENRYSVSFESTSGEKKLIAVANVADGAYWENLITDLTAAYNEKKNFEQVKAIVAEMSQRLVNQAGTTEGMQPFHIASSSQMLISGWNEGVVFGTGDAVTKYGTYGDETNNVAIKMKRAMAHITFNIAANPTGAKGTFTPTSFRVYNIPTKSHLTNGIPEGTNLLTTGVADVEYVNTAFENIGTAQGGNYSFNFYMPENVQEEKNVGAYNDRDVWTGASGASAENKTWTNAPQNSTFVVISGTYEGTAQGQPVTANVEYTIHLGDFSDSGSMGNFSVERNYSYTYNVQVLGVDNIVVEAKKEGGDQQGAEGSVYDQSSTEYSYNLDAHYEQVYLEYNLSDIANSLGQGLSGQSLDDAIANQLILIIQSEAMDYTHESTPDEPYTTRNKRGTLSPYKIYADAVRSGKDPADVKAAVLNGAGEGIAPTKGFDYKWIEFLPQTGTGISKYPGISSWAMEDLDDVNNKSFYADAGGNNSMLDVYDMIVEMGKAIKNIYLNGSATSDKIEISTVGNDYVARFTAFVNEYYYLHHPLTGSKATSWSVMTNKIPREMIIAMSTQTSTDGNSSYSKIHSYISQLAMQTFYNDRVSSLNAFGIETYNETPLKWYYGTPRSTYGLTDNDGLVNQKILINANSSPSWDTYITYANNGWKSSVGADRVNHKLADNAYRVQAAYSACMSRNRDLNGNGQIDENEIRWFLPSLNEYIRMGIGANAISSAAQLYMGDKTSLVNPAENNPSSGYPYKYVSEGALYYTSSEANKRVYWAIEKGSYSSETADWYYRSPLPIRCIRNLPASGSTSTTDISSIENVTSDATYELHPRTSARPYILEFRNRLVPSLYRQRVSGSLNIHNEDNDANSFYDGIFVAHVFLDDAQKLGDVIGYNGTMINPCSTYSEGGYRNWRVPNLVELSAMNAAGLLDNCNTSYIAACCTQFTKLNVRYGFGRSTLIYCPGGPTDVGVINNYGFRIRCVRDVPSDYTFPTN